MRVRLCLSSVALQTVLKDGASNGLLTRYVEQHAREGLAYHYDPFSDCEVRMTFKVQQRMCSTCIYRPDTPLDLKKLEDQIRDPHGGFTGYRICHHSTNVCCRGFWEAHKDEFAVGQVAQRLNMVEYVYEDNQKER
jgi:hypothetical protein